MGSDIRNSHLVFPQQGLVGMGEAMTPNAEREWEAELEAEASHWVTGFDGDLKLDVAKEFIRKVESSATEKAIRKCAEIAKTYSYDSEKEGTLIVIHGIAKSILACVDGRK